MSVHLLKLCVGADDVRDLRAWQQRQARSHVEAGSDPRPLHVTRMWPKRAGEILDGGSLYWVIRGTILVRQRIIALEPIEDGTGVRRCGIRLDPELFATTPQPRRPFQGWRYVAEGDAPQDVLRADLSLPAGLSTHLNEVGVI